MVPVPEDIFGPEEKWYGTTQSGTVPLKVVPVPNRQ